MAIYHLHVKNISRGNGRSIVAAAAYRAGETLPNEGEERLSAFGGRRDVLYAEIRVPLDAPAWAAERAQLWNAAEAAERRKDARLAKEIEIALPRDLPRPTWLRLARAMADIYTAQGFVADLAIHDDGSAHNPHVHILLTTRVLTESGFGPKIREADGLKFVTDARKSWETLANEALTEAGLSGVDARCQSAS
ncbi:MobA/MobL family protein [Rhizobium sp. AB2/73]|uniref:MobA/MobL family protein n=1 Tax=Rhizobium sp. AB2/73 TaxID=2795216 RepID=UPI001C5CC678|nr:MobA/MobL family protein [Rhizobium sp. AB2/73]QYA12026.1 MobA/MobL family protein [Rhizobium sp. AB2/73]UEQ82043.1 MobA/MobL family protein [Rhizobium sp. AB2/73]